ncbi:hypothetical protein AAC387_Pa02g4559 [Persea americana]
MSNFILDLPQSLLPTRARTRHEGYCFHSQVFHTHISTNSFTKLGLPELQLAIIPEFRGTDSYPLGKTEEGQMFQAFEPVDEPELSPGCIFGDVTEDVATT